MSYVTPVFGAHANTYDQNSVIQRQIACDLLTHCPDLETPRILEIGCGTGHLTELLLTTYPNGAFIITDTSSKMIDVCQDKCRARNTEFYVMDGEFLQHSLGQFDLIVSSMTAQWFQAPKESLETWTNYLKPSGHILISTISEGYWPEWREAIKKSNVSNVILKTPEYPEKMEHAECFYREVYNNARGFLRHLKETGASASSIRLPPQDLKNLMRTYNALYPTGQITWKIAFGHLQV